MEIEKTVETKKETSKFPSAMGINLPYVPFVYAGDLSNILQAFSRKFEFRTISGVAKDLGKTEEEILNTMRQEPILFLQSNQDPNLYTLNPIPAKIDPRAMRLIYQKILGG